MAHRFPNNSSNTTFVTTIVLTFFLLLKCCRSFNLKLMNMTMYESPDNQNWSPAGATWYGPPHGFGTNGGACGYQGAVGQPPFSAMISAGGPSIYQSGKGCGDCYQVKCTNNEACSGNPVTVTITDECPGCTSEAIDFDLSGTGFGALAKPGQDDRLRNAGVLQVQYTKVECNYAGVTVAVDVDAGSNPYYFAVVIEYEDGSGIAKVELRQQSESGWTNMAETHGATYAVNAGYQLQVPFSIRLTENKSGNTLVLDRIIPFGWKPGQTYRCRVNFKN